MPGRLATTLLFAAIGLFAWQFIGVLAGDAVIHLVFAENALAGDWFVFNPGESSSGESSAGYLLITTALMALVGHEWTPYGMVALGFLAWLGMLLLWLRLWRSLFPDSVLPLIGLGLVGFMPGSALNSVIGMENVHFGLGVAGIVWWLHRNEALATGRPMEKMAVLGLMLGGLTLIRLEAVLVAIGVLGWQWLWLAGKGDADRKQDLAGSALAAGIVAVIFGAMLLAVWSLSGALPFGGGAARLSRAMTEGFTLGPVPLHGKMLFRLAVYGPLALGWLLGVQALAKDENETGRDLVALVAALSAGFIVAFSTILPSVHLARYTIFLWPLLVTVALYGVKHPPRFLVERQRIAVACGALSIVALIGIYGFELKLRRAMPTRHGLDELRTVPDQREAFTDELLRTLDYRGPLPVTLGLVEVQWRYFYDDRVVVRSMDGIVDTLFNQYVDESGVDYPGYLRARKVDYLIGHVGLVGSSSEWSPAQMRTLPEGEVVIHGGVRFERGAGKVTRLSYLPVRAREDTTKGMPGEGR